jgi:hypothetical protein
MMDGNGVAREFWSEILDLMAPADDDRGGRREVRRKKFRPGGRTSRGRVEPLW